jgi:hypothetical protein
VEDERPVGFGVLDAGDLGAGVGALRVLTRGHDDCDGSTVRRGELDAGELAARGGRQRAEEVPFQPRHDRLRLRVTEAAVELEHLRPGLRQHQPGEEHSREGRSSPRELLDHRAVHLLDQLGHLVRPHARHRRVRAHAARVRSRVAVPDALEVLRRRQRHHRATVREREHGYLLAREQLLDHDRAGERGRGAEPFVELRSGLADEHALAGREPVDLDDAGSPRHRQRLGGRNPRSGHDVLRKALRALDPRRRAAGSEHGDAVSAQLVGDPGDERRLRADHGQVDVEAPRETEQRLAVLAPHRVTVAEAGDPGVAGRGVQRREPRRLGELPGERMLASARADQEHLHGGRVYFQEGFTHVPAAHERRVSIDEPGLDLHEWETRWAELEEALAEDPLGALPEACDLIEAALGADHVSDELEVTFQAARDTADAIERGDEVDLGDVGAAVGNLRAVRAALRPGLAE